MENQLVSVAYHLATLVTEKQNCVLEILMDKDVALVHLIPAEMYEGFAEEDEEDD